MVLAPDAPSLADPERKRKRQTDGRAGTILTGGNPGQGGTTLGGPGNRSNLLGL